MAVLAVRGGVVLVDDADFTELAGYSWVVTQKGYVARSAGKGNTVLMHRHLLGLPKGDPRIGDHRNGNKLDHRRANLRVVTPSESSANVAGRAKSGYRGVYPCKGRWQARAKRDGCMVNLGTFDSPEEAYEVSHAWRIDNLPGYIDRLAVA